MTELDLGRLDTLAQQLDETPASIAQTLRGELQAAFSELDAALLTHDRDAAARACHAARNSALMLSATPMLAALRAIDEALRAGDDAAITMPRHALAASWAQVDAALRAAGG